MTGSSTASWATGTGGCYGPPASSVAIDGLRWTKSIKRSWEWNPMALVHARKKSITIRALSLKWPLVSHFCECTARDETMELISQAIPFLEISCVTDMDICAFNSQESG